MEGRKEGEEGEEDGRKARKVEGEEGQSRKVHAAMDHHDRPSYPKSRTLYIPPLHDSITIVDSITMPMLHVVETCH